jgi:uncharacterized protein YegL
LFYLKQVYACSSTIDFPALNKGYRNLAKCTTAFNLRYNEPLCVDHVKALKKLFITRLKLYVFFLKKTDERKIKLLSNEYNTILCNQLKELQECAKENGYLESLKKVEEKITESLSCISRLDYCGTKNDIILIWDDSGSIGVTNFKMEITLLRSLTSNFEISNVKTRIASIRFASSATQDFGFVDNNNTLMENFDKILNTGTKGGGTNMGEALEQAEKLFRDSGRNDATRLVIIATDGMDSDKNYVDTVLNRLKVANFKIVAFGVGLVDTELLKKYSDYYLEKSSFPELAKAADEIRGNICAVVDI